MALEFSKGVLILLLMIGSVSSVTERDDRSGRRWTYRSDETSDGEKTIVAADGDTIALHCQFRVSLWSTVQWFKFQVGVDDTPKAPLVLSQSVTATNGSFSIATLKNVNEGDEGNYSCVLATFQSGSKSYLFQVTVKRKLSCGIDSCSLNGNCVETVAGYTCECEGGFIGVSCELRDPCFENPCQHNGTCIADGESFNCTCLSGYGGANCESEVCTSNTCGGGGNCTEEDGHISCACPRNRTGDRCQYVCRQMNYRHNYCYGSITCKISVSSGVERENCVCDERRRYDGARCMMESDVRNECEDPYLCHGRGSCDDFVFGYRCNCNSYAHGTNCKLYDECRSGSNLCARNGGRCVDLPEGYKCTDCPEGQHGDKCQYMKNPCKVTCGGSSMRLSCDTRFMKNKMRTIPMYLNWKTDSCRLPAFDRYNYGYRSRWSRMMDVDYSRCGTEMELGDYYVVYRNNLRVGNSINHHANSNNVITRDVGHFLFKMECKLPLVRNTSKGLKDLSLLANETLDLEDHKSIPVSGTNINIYKDMYYRQQITSYVVGERLFVEMSIATHNNRAFSRGYKLHPTSCYATASRNGDGERYMLLEDGCVRDETFRFENGTHYGADQHRSYFSFDSFSFKSDPGNLYLHCTSIACLNPAATSHENCGNICKNESDPTKAETTSAPTEASTRGGETDQINRKPGPSVEVFTSKSR